MTTLPLFIPLTGVFLLPELTCARTFENGKIAEIGTHDELLEKRGVFFKLVTAQKAMNEITAVGG